MAMDGLQSLELDHALGRPELVDPFGRAITYVRVSVTDRCDFRCVYCMAEDMTFLPKKDVLSLEELDRLCSAFVARGVRKLRLTGGEPLVRKTSWRSFDSLSRHLALRRARRADADHQRLAARPLSPASSPTAACGGSTSRSIRSIRKIQGHHALGRSRTRCLPASPRAQAAGIHVKINTVALKGVNEDEIHDLIHWAHGRGMDLTLIETMPLGEIDGDRTDQYLPLCSVRARAGGELSRSTDIAYRTGGPARYVRVAETGGRLGFITPLTHNFCESCNRVRVTCTGTLYMCLGQEDAADLRTPLRASEADELLHAAHRRSDLAQAERPRLHHRPPRTSGRPSPAT